MKPLHVQVEYECDQSGRSEQIVTAHIYLHADMNQKERAIARVTPPGTTAGRYQPADPLLAFLDSL